MPGEIWFTSDHHFGHSGIISMCSRPFLDADEMDEEMIRRWNERVRKSDVVYHLGDFAMKSTAERCAQIFGRLNGRKHLIIGNHDRLKVRSLPWASEPRDRVMLRHPEEKLPLVLDHYALRTWPGMHYGAVHLFGHSHGILRGIGRSEDVGVDVWDFRPVTLGEIRPTLDRQQAMLEDAKAARDVSDVDDDPLGYDTSDPGYLRQMAEDAINGVNEGAVDEELARVRRRLGRGSPD